MDKDIRDHNAAFNVAMKRAMAVHDIELMVRYLRSSRPLTPDHRERLAELLEEFDSVLDDRFYDGLERGVERGLELAMDGQVMDWPADKVERRPPWRESLPRRP